MPPRWRVRASEGLCRRLLGYVDKGTRYQARRDCPGHAYHTCMRCLSCAGPSTWLAGRCSVPGLPAASELAGGITGRACVVSPTARRWAWRGLARRAEGRACNPSAPLPSLPPREPSRVARAALRVLIASARIGWGEVAPIRRGDTREKASLSRLHQRSRLARAQPARSLFSKGSPQTRRRAGEGQTASEVWGLDLRVIEMQDQGVASMPALRRLVAEKPVSQGAQQKKTPRDPDRSTARAASRKSPPGQPQQRQRC